MNNTSTSANVITTGLGSIIDNVTFYYLTLVIRCLLNPVAAFMAFVFAIINVATFVQLDLSLGVNMNLLILSISDFVVAIIGVIGNVSYIFILLNMRNQAFRQILFIATEMINYPLIASAVVTTVIAVVRCLSVVMPVSFKTSVTPCRQLLAMALGCCFGCSVLVYNQIVSIGVVSRAAGRNSQVVAFDISRNVFFMSCVAINFVTIVFLTHALKKSSKFQSTASTVPSGQSRAFHTRNARVIKTVVLILVIFVACYTPIMSLSIMRLAVSEFLSSARYRNVKDLTEMLVGLMMSFNVALNTVVYFTYNSRFREIAKRLFFL